MMKPLPVRTIGDTLFIWLPAALLMSEPVGDMTFVTFAEFNLKAIVLVPAVVLRL